MELSDGQIERYSRQIVLEEVGGRGQAKLLGSKVLVVGVGGLGSPACLYLAAAGVGTIGIIDSDKVELTNLQRQVLYGIEDVGRDKVDPARERIAAMNPEVEVKAYKIRANAGNISEIVREYDFVIDGTDNFAAKFLINDACYFERRTFSHAGVLRFYGQLMTVEPGESACYRCIFPSPPEAGVVPTCSQAGILGAVPAVIGSLQATEALKHVLGVGELLTDRLLTYNALTMGFRRVRVRRNPDCPLCGEGAEIKELKDEEPPVCDLEEEERERA